MPKSALRLSAIAFAVFASSASATPKEDLHAAFARFLQAKSFRATVTDLKKNEQVSTMEYVAPDRYRMQSLRGPARLIVGDSLYIESEGKLTRMPVPGVGKMVAQFRNEDFLRQTEGDMQVQALPDEVVDGTPTHVFHYAVTQPVQADAKTWISAKTGLPLQTESVGSFMGIKSTTRVRYSDYNDPTIRIDAPN